MEKRGLKDNVLYVLLKPDAFIQNRYRQIIKYFNSLGVYVLNAKIIKVNYELYRIMYEDTFTPSFDDLEYNFKFFNFAPCLSILFDCSKVKNIENLQYYFAKKKGNAIPELIKDKNSIRYKLKATNRVFNLVHIPVTKEQANLETAIIKLSDNIENFDINILYKNIKIYNSTNFKNYKILFNIIKYRILYSIHNNNNSHIFNYEKFINYLRLYYKESKSDKVDFFMESIIKNLKNNNLSANQRKYIKIFEVIYNIEKKHYNNLIFNLNYLWQLLEDNFIFVSELEKYFISTSLLYPTKNNITN
jgi:hypothetical protein